MASNVQYTAPRYMALGDLDWADGGVTFRAMLLTSSHTQDQTDEFVADVVANEVSDASYSRQAVTGRTVVVNGSNEVDCGASDTPWAGLDVVVPAFVAVYKFVTNDADSTLVAIMELTATPAADGTTYTMQWPSGVVFKLAA